VSPLTRRLAVFAPIGAVALGGAARAAGWSVPLALGLYLLAVAGGLFARLHALGGLAQRAVGAYAFAVLALALQLALAFLGGVEPWLAGLAGFGATVGPVGAACLPFLDRTLVLDPGDDVRAGSAPIRVEGKPLDRAGRLLLLAYSQVVVAANGLLSWHTFHAR